MARSVSWLLIGLGVIVLIDAGVTIVWQEPLSALYTTVKQHELAGSLEALDTAPVVGQEAHSLRLLHGAKARIKLLARDLEDHAAEGSAVGRIEIPHIGANYVLVDGTSTSSLEKGPGVYSHTIYPRRSFPGLRGTTAIAGHRTTFLAPFRHINDLTRGDKIFVTMPYGRFTYTVEKLRTVLPTDVAAAVRPVGHPQLVLSACTPAFSASHRLLVYARQTAITPLGAARVYDERLLAKRYRTSMVAKGVGLPVGGLRHTFFRPTDAHSRSGSRAARVGQ
jgi:sortase A